MNDRLRATLGFIEKQTQRPDDLTEAERPSYVELGARHALPPTQITNYLAWARRTLRALVQDRLRGVTAGDRELREEMRRAWN